MRVISKTSRYNFFKEGKISKFSRKRENSQIFKVHGRFKVTKPFSIFISPNSSNSSPSFLGFIPPSKRYYPKEIFKKRDEEARVLVNHDANGGSDGNDIDKRKKKKKKEKKKNDDIPTVSIALPGSIIDNTQSFELATRLAGQIARAATIFRIDVV